MSERLRREHVARIRIALVVHLSLFPTIRRPIHKPTNEEMGYVNPLLRYKILTVCVRLTDQHL